MLSKKGIDLAAAAPRKPRADNYTAMPKMTPEMARQFFMSRAVGTGTRMRSGALQLRGYR